MKKNILSFILCMCFLFICVSCNKENDMSEEVKAYRNNKMNIYMTENEKYDDYEVDVAFLGDSLTDGYDVSKYYPNYVVSNRGIGGETTTGLLERIKVSLYDLKPKVAVMLIGANNMDTMFNDYEDLLIGFKENVPNTKIILLSLTSMSKEWGKKNQLAAYSNVKIRKFAEEYNYEYVDLYYALFNNSTGQIYDEYTTDGGHLTSKGYEVVTSTVTPVIDKMLALYKSENNK